MAHRSKASGKKPPNSWKILIIIASLSAVATLSAFWYLRFMPVYKVEDLGIDVYVYNKGGFNLDTDAIHFGIVPPGGSGERSMVIRANELRTIIRMETYGDISGWVSVSENNFVLEPYENRTVLVRVAVPEDAKSPDYKKGTMRVIFSRA